MMIRDLEMMIRDHDIKAFIVYYLPVSNVENAKEVLKRLLCISLFETWNYLVLKLFI